LVSGFKTELVKNCINDTDSSRYFAG